MSVSLRGDVQWMDFKGWNPRVDHPGGRMMVALAMREQTMGGSSEGSRSGSSRNKVGRWALQCFYSMGCCR